MMLPTHYYIYRFYTQCADGATLNSSFPCTLFIRVLYLKMYCNNYVITYQTALICNYPFISFLFYSVDLDFERYKPGTVVVVNSDGFISWLTPSIMTSYCRVRVHNFPFDTQVCEMVFASWSFTTLDIDLHPELGPDATQNR